MANEFRPTQWNEYIGQEDAKLILEAYLKSAQRRNSVLEHTLFYGPPGVGKTSLAELVANSQQGNFFRVDDLSVSSPEKLFEIIPKIKHGDVLFVDEIHRLPRDVCEKLYLVMEDFHYQGQTQGGWYLSKVDYKYHSQRQDAWIEIPRFTLVGATTHAGNIPKPMLDRFMLKINLVLYTDDELAKIVQQTLIKMGMSFDVNGDVPLQIARRSRGVPRIAIDNAGKVRSACALLDTNFITQEAIELAFKMHKMDENGLTELDYRYLTSFNGRPLGIDALANLTGEESINIKNIVEPHLLRLKLVEQTQRGRMITQKGITYLESHGFSRG